VAWGGGGRGREKAEARLLKGSERRRKKMLWVINTTGKIMPLNITDND